MTTELEQTSKKVRSSVDLSKSLISEIDGIKEAEGFKSRESVIELLLNERANNAKEQSEDSAKFDFGTDLDAEDFETLKEICQNDGISYKEFAKASMVSALKKYRTQSENKPNFEAMSLKDLEKIMKKDSEGKAKGRTYKGLAEARIAKVVELVQAHNDNQPEKKFKWFISPSLIAKLTGSNRPAINNFFEQYEVMIKDHNAKHELKDLDNRKGIGEITIESLKQKLGLMSSDSE